MTARKRREDETYEEYRNSLVMENTMEKMQLLGTVIHDSAKEGTFWHDEEAKHEQFSRSCR